MINPRDIKLNSTVNFELYAPTILGNGLQNVKVLGIMDAETAALFGINPPLMHANVYAHLPPDTPNDFNGYPYLKVRLASGVTTAYGLAWIRDSSWQEVSVASLRLTIHGVQPEGRAIIKQALAANGFTAVNIEELP